MEREETALLAHQMKDRTDLLKLLNLLKMEEITAAGYADKFYPFTVKHMNYFCNPNNTFHRYTRFHIKKKTGGVRTITAPYHRSFMLLLTYLNEILKSIYTPSDYAMGFTEGRSVVTNAERHKGMNYVLNLDLKDFFPSIEQPRVWKRLQLAPFNFPIPVANAIAGLCCMKQTLEGENGDKDISYVLPQGAPTSPIITNMICDKLDRRLAGVARRFGLNYSRYADDITFSSMHNVYQKNGSFMNEVTRIITDQGFTINEKKTRLQKVGSRQEVTGVIVSDKLNVTQKYVRDLRNILYIWNKYGYSVALAKFYPKYKLEKGHVKKGVPRFEYVLAGKLMYLKMVKGESDSVYQRLNDKFQELYYASKVMTDADIHGIAYLETLSIAEFERKNSTKLVIAYSKGVNGAESHRYAYFKLGETQVNVSVKKSIKKEDETAFERLAISNCIDSKEQHFWLIHYKNQPVRTLTPTVDIDALNQDLDTLLNLKDE